MTLHKNRTAVLALGGNAISPRGEQDTIANQFRHTRQSMVAVHHLIDRGFNLTITHGNGPQVGNALLRVELSADQAPILPLGICVADIEGGMGYMIQQSIQNLLRENDIEQDVVTLITQVVVDRNDPEITNPSKFIGQLYNLETAHRLAERFGWTIREMAESSPFTKAHFYRGIGIYSRAHLRREDCGGGGRWWYSCLHYGERRP